MWYRRVFNSWRITSKIKSHLTILHIRLAILCLISARFLHKKHPILRGYTTTSWKYSAPAPIYSFQIWKSRKYLSGLVFTIRTIFRKCSGRKWRLLRKSTGRNMRIHDGVWREKVYDTFQITHQHPPHDLAEYAHQKSYLPDFRRRALPSDWAVASSKKREVCLIDLFP